LEFVSFHVALSPDRTVHPNQTVAHKEYLAMLDMMFASASLFHPGARRVVITDTQTSFEGMSSQPDAIARFPMDSQRLMMERAKAQQSYVQQSRFDRPILLLDSDILINGTLAHLFEQDFDVAVTWRASKNMPVNGGLLILNNRRPDVAKAFFERYVRTYQEQYAEQAAWYGDQLALRDCVGLTVKQYRKYRIHEVDGCRILLLPCDIYNSSPDNSFGEIDRPREEKLVLHFKGERKRLMGPFWRAWLHPRCSSNPLVRLRGWRERRLLATLRSEAAPSSQGLEEEDA
jgi:hypothetical protein